MITDENRVFGVSEAMKVLRPNCNFTIENEVLEWLDENQDAPTQDEIRAKIDELQAEHDAKAYARSRTTEYPSIGDQLDMLWHAIDAGTLDKTSDFYTTLKAVKDANPKPEGGE